MNCLAIALTLVSLSAHLLAVAIGIATVLRGRRCLRREARVRATRVSILKPLAGTDDDLLGNLESFATLEGAPYEILFGVGSRGDPAVEVVHELLRRHPTMPARLVVTDPDAALNPKVAQLVGLEREATGEVIVISDSNVRVGRRYLAHLLDALAGPRVGLVSNVIVGTGERTLGAALENLLIAAYVTPGVLSSHALSACPITIGKSLAMRRTDLRRVGGFSRVADVLAEDHVLARIFAAAGMRVSLCFDSIENRNVVGGMRRSFERHTRWAKIRRAMAPIRFLFEPLLLPVVIATIAYVVSPTPSMSALVAGVAAAEVLAAWLAMSVLRGRAMPWYLVPLPLVKSFVLFACFLRAWTTRHTEWRGHALRIGRNTILEPARPRTIGSGRGEIRASVRLPCTTNDLGP